MSSTNPTLSKNLSTSTLEGDSASTASMSIDVEYDENIPNVESKLWNSSTSKYQNVDIALDGEKEDVNINYNL